LSNQRFAYPLKKHKVPADEALTRARTILHERGYRNILNWVYGCVVSLELFEKNSRRLTHFTIHDLHRRWFSTNSAGTPSPSRCHITLNRSIYQC